MKEMKRANPNHNFFCNPQLCDALTIALSYMYDPSRFRVCCHFTLGVWEQAVYLEGELPCAFGRLSMTDLVPTVPLLTMKGLNGQVPVLVLRKIPQLFSLDHKAIGSAKARSITITELPKLNKVGNDFLRICTSLKQVVFKDLPELTEVGDNWMHGCTALESMTISHLPKLNKVGDDFLRNCTSLKHAELEIPANVASELVSRCPPFQQLGKSREAEEEPKKKKKKKKGGCIVITEFLLLRQKKTFFLSRKLYVENNLIRCPVNIKFVCGVSLSQK